MVQCHAVCAGNGWPNVTPSELGVLRYASECFRTRCASVCFGVLQDSVCFGMLRFVVVFVTAPFDGDPIRLRKVMQWDSGMLRYASVFFKGSSVCF